MLCRRRLNRYRSRKTFIIFVVAGLFLCILLAYRSLNSADANASHHGSLPTMMEKRKPRYQAAHPRHKLFAEKTRNEMRKNLLQQFNAGLKVSGVQEVLSLLYPGNWKLAKDADEAAIVLKDMMLSLDLHSPMSCKEISDFQIQGTLGSSSRKYVERLEEPQSSGYDRFDPYTNRNQNQRKKVTMAVKSQGNDIQTKVACMKQGRNADSCGPMGNYLLMREIFLFRFLQHPSLISLLGYCLRGDHISMDLRGKGLVLVMESGIPLSMNLVTSLSWSHRLKLALDVAYLLEYLQSSPLGEVALPRVQLKDFVLVNHKSLKLTDLDEAELQEKRCSSDPECRLQGTDVGVKCQDGHCTGLSHKVNLRVVGTFVLDPLLRQPPPEEMRAVSDIRNRIKSLDIAVFELVNFLEAMVKKYSITYDELQESHGYQSLKEKAEKHFHNGMSANVKNVVKDPVEDNEDEDEDEDDDDDDGDTQEDKALGKHSRHTAEENPRPETYLRKDSSNFPGQYDYSCPDSRVLWGCVMTFNTLASAMERCSSDSDCLSFVVFSPSPERESKMTVVFKNKNTGPTHVNLGTTLFIKKNNMPSQGDEQPLVNNGIEDNEIPSDQQGGKSKVKPPERVKVDPWAQLKELQECIQRSQTNQADAFSSREKRLMAHMGLKGKEEKEWKRAVRIRSITSYSNLRPLTESGDQGGTMTVHYNTSTAGHIISQAKFMVEKGQKQNHVAYALVYHIDRLLGLFHTPPAVEGFIPKSVVEKFSGNKTWKSTFDSLLHRDGSLRGLFVTPTPRVIKKSELLLEPLDQMVQEITAFDRTQKVQLEYVLLWWLGHVAKPNNVHYGFKGHLIHVDADQGFQEPNVNYEGYFNHCQFPNVVYKMLMCFRCHHGTTTKVCFLGQEVERRLSAAGLKLLDLNIKDLADEDYIIHINEAATRAMDIIDTCIQDFGRENVLY